MINPNVEAFKRTMTGKKVSVLGLGVSNIPALGFLSECGAIITGCDKRSEDVMEPSVMAEIRKHCDFYHLGEDYLDHLEGQDIVLRSPGINPSLEQLAKAREAGTVITSEMEIFMSLCPCKMIAVTGSDGKTTTTTLIYEILTAAGYNCYKGGNIGTPLLDKVESMNPDEIVVLELSSFQLMNIGVSPHVAVITNISPNHLDYHKDMSEYVEAKATIFAHQDKNDKLVINADNSITGSFRGRQKGSLESFSRLDDTADAYYKDGWLLHKGEKIVEKEKIKIPGWHNVENYLAAICATAGLVEASHIRKVAENFGGVEHRMELVRTIDGINFYNDSIGSSPTRTIAGLVAQNDDVVLIAGGKDKNLDYSELGNVIKDKVKILVLIGATADKIEASVVKAYGGLAPAIPITRVDNYKDAVASAFALARGLKPGGNRVSVILSPASTSFDMFKNFEERGKTFKKYVNELTE